MQIRIPQIVVPKFWLSNLAAVETYLDTKLQRGRLLVAGETVQGRKLRVVEYEQPGRPRLMVIAGTHGHEPGTVASSMNLIHLLETGEDLDGRKHPELLAALAQVHLYVCPMLNPDGRAVCPDSFYAQGLDTVTVYSSGLKLDGDLVPYDADSDQPCYYFDPSEAIFVGGQFNAAGWAINRRLSDEHSEAIEVQQLLDFVKPLGLEAVLDLHACGYNFAMQARSHPAPYWPVIREWQARAEPLFAAKGRQLRELYGDGNPPQPPDYFFNSILFHKQAKLGWMGFEGRQGYVGSSAFMPLPSEWEIIDDYLTAVTIFLQLGGEGLWTQANRETFGGR
ncbi:MAG: M14 family zinc carboxypeptidase [Bacteroidota bacterium]